MRPISPKHAALSVIGGAGVLSLAVAAWAVTAKGTPARFQPAGNAAASQPSAAASVTAASVAGTATRAHAAATATAKKAAVTAAARTVHDLLKPGHALRAGRALHSANGKYTLLQQADGNLVLYRGAHPLWGTMTASPGAFTEMQKDGNLVVYSASGQPLWGAGTAPSAGAYLAVQNDGNLVIYSRSGSWLWSRYLYLQQLPSGRVLSPGQAILSHSRHYALAMQPDGNLVLYHGNLYGAKTAVWGTMTSSSGAYAVMQADGNLVVYSKRKRPLWSSGTSSPGASLAVQDDGNVVIYSTGGKALWDRHLYLNTLPAGAVLKPGMAVVSQDFQHELFMQTDGNLVLCKGPLYGKPASMTALWSSKTASPGAYAVMQSDGNLVVYSAAKKPLWSSGTSSPGAYLMVQNDSNMVLYSAAQHPLWSTSTTGK